MHRAIRNCGSGRSRFCIIGIFFGNQSLHRKHYWMAAPMEVKYAGRVGKGFGKLFLGKRKIKTEHGLGAKRIRDPYVGKAVARSIYPIRRLYRPAYDGVMKTHPARLRCGYSFNFAPAAAFYHYPLLLNSAYAPDPAVAVVQPTFHDQLSAIYRRYMVTSGWIWIQVTNASTDPIMVFFYVNQAINAPATNNIESMMGRSDNSNVTVPKAAADFPVRRIVRKFTNLQPYSYQNPNDDVSGASVTGNPPNTVYGHLYIISPTGGNVSGRIDYKIFQNVNYYNRKDVEDDQQ